MRGKLASAAGIAALLLVVSAPPAAAQGDKPWQLRDRETKLHLIAAGFLDEDADQASLKTVAGALSRFRTVFDLKVPEADGPVSDQDLASIGRSANANPFSSSILNKPLAAPEVALLRRFKSELDARVGAKLETSEHNVNFLLPQGFARANASGGYHTYRAQSEVPASKARVVVEGMDVISIGANRRTLIDLFEARTRTYVAKTLHYEALNLSADRMVAQFVFGIDAQSRYTYRMYVAGDRLIGLSLAASVDPVPGFVPMESHRRLAEYVVDKEPLSGWLTQIQCAKLKINCDAKGLGSGAEGQAAEELRAAAIRSVAWRAMSSSVVQTLMSNFDGSNGWRRFPAQDCYFERRKTGIEQVRIVAGSDRGFDSAKWADPTSKIGDVFDETASGNLGLYCILVEVPKNPAEKLPNAEPEGYRIARQPTVEIGTVERGFDRFSIDDSTRQRPGDRALIYIHGFNNTMKDAIERAAMIGKALNTSYWGRFYLYSWPSAYSVAKYVDDLDRSEQAEAHLRNFIRMIARDPNVDRIDFVAHSMGSALLLRALSGLSLEVAGTKHIGHVILAAPDIQSNVFASRMALVAPFASRVTIYATEKDRALAWRKTRYGGEVRIGARTSVETPFKNVHFIDVSELVQSWYQDPLDSRHGYFVSNAGVLADIADVLKSGQVASLDQQETAIAKARADRKAVLQPAGGYKGNAKVWKLMPAN